MISAEPQSTFQGFGIGTQQGEYHWSLNMKKTQYGITPAWAMQPITDSASISGMGYFNWLSQLKTANLASNYGVDGNGVIYQYDGNLAVWKMVYKPGGTTFGNGLITDQKNRLLYIGSRYVGMFDPTVSNYTAGTVQVASGSANIVGTGTTFTSGMVGKRFQIANDPNFYTVATFTDATHIALSTNYVGSNASGLSYTVFSGWTDQWKDLGANVSPTSQLMQAETYEGSLLILYGSQIALLAMSDDSFNTNAFNVPSGMTLVSIKAGRTGVLIAGTFQNRSVLILWDAFSIRSIAPWTWVNATVQGLAYDNGNWIVVTDKGVIFTNGYTIQTDNQSSVTVQYPDKPFNTAGVSLATPQAMAVERGYLFIGNSSGFPYSRTKNCILALNLETKLWEEITPSTGHTANVTYGAMMQDNSNYSFWISYTTSIPAKTFIDVLNNGAPARAAFITAPLGTANSNSKTAEAVKLELSINPFSYDNYPLSMNVAVKVCASKRPYWGYGVTSGISANGTQLPLDMTRNGFNQPQVGDEITIMEGVNAGLVAHVASITNSGASNAVIVLDTTFPSVTEASVHFNIAPFRLVDKQALTNLSQLRDLWFNVTSKLQGKKFLVKIVIDGINVVAPELRSTLFVYDDLGVM
jgi:hypothetical protein